jgi:hypothetical protein
MAVDAPDCDWQRRNLQERGVFGINTAGLSIDQQASHHRQPGWDLLLENLTSRRTKHAILGIAREHR